MQFSKSVIELIKERTSRRTFDKKALENKTKENLIKILDIKNIETPFKSISGARFLLINTPEFDPEERKKIGTYGMIKGAQEFIAGAIEKSDYNLETYGYLLEMIILGVTDLDLGTCWLGGTFNRSLFSDKIQLKPSEILPAITPIGYMADRTVKEKAIRKFVKANSRMPWEKLFFTGNFSTPCDQNNIGNYSTILEMVRLGPSAGNKQPWRVVKEQGRNIFHFYVRFSQDLTGKVYNQFVRLDIGIAICHFDLTAKELGMKGKWEITEPEFERPKELKYIISWIGQ